MFGCYNILGFSYWTSSIANLFLTSILSYFLNSRCTFNSDEKGLKSVLKFAANISVCYLFSYVLSRQIINLFLIGVSVNIRDNISMFMGMILFIIAKTLMFGDPVAGYPSLVCIIFLLSGLILLCTGIQGQYLAKTYMETKKRPLFITKEESLNEQESISSDINSHNDICHT